MRKIMLVFGLIVLMIALTACAPETTVEEQEEPEAPAEKLAPDGVDVMPDISISECLSQIKQTNPEMTDQQASDNCYTIEAVNKNDKSICNQVSEAARANCLAMFE